MSMNPKLINGPIRAIIDNEVPPEHIFDSHFVIARLIKKHSDEYLRFAASIGENVKTDMMHGFIAQEIGTFNDVVRIQPDACSENIHGEPNPCACWKRVAKSK